MWNKIDPKTIDKNVFSMIGDQWMLITAGTAERCNTMTASWGGLGVLWGKNVAMAFIRPQRYTFEFVEKNDWFTLSFLPECYRKQMSFCGTKSGRDTDKVKECGFTVNTGEGGAPYMNEAELVLVCRKLYWQDFDRTHFLDASIEKNYLNHDYHRMYVGEIVEALRKG